MPELPEVESFKKFVEETSLHKKIKEIDLTDNIHLLNVTKATFLKELKNHQFEKVIRHGKFMFIELDSGKNLLVHFGVTGYFDYIFDNKIEKKYALLVKFTNGESLVFYDRRKFGKLSIVKDVEAFIKARKYGKDALDISEKEFVEIFRKKKTNIKTSLMNQKNLAGVGNEFADEILFQARLHPEALVTSLSDSKLKEVYKKMVKVLKDAVKVDADREKLKKYFFLDNRKAGLICPHCGGKTEFKTVGGRSSYFCPKCQKIK